ncbi:hypothetical protein ATANTOWER_029330 [Ataeniobius toweri]|uniref:Uncharacterized protein n=1 Tax=Ataeniobius toweri TaxID=208326 RepID=A0ABU7C3Y7_9TELE|nr:hypothetical protein [Ataeniobius toweri]
MLTCFIHSSMHPTDFHGSNMSDLDSIVLGFTIQCKDILDLIAPVKQSTAQCSNCCPWINEGELVVGLNGCGKAPGWMLYPFQYPSIPQHDAATILQRLHF